VQVLSGLSELLGSASEAEPETLYRCRLHESDFKHAAEFANVRVLLGMPSRARISVS
jgi:hypothetical protein